MELLHLLNKNWRKQNHGQSLIELLLAIGLLAIVIPSILTVFVVSRQGKPQQLERTKAVAALQEAEEAIRTIRQTNWDDIATNGTFHPIISGSKWTLETGVETIDSETSLTRQIDIEDVYRDNTGKIVPEGDDTTLDPSSKKVTITVSWQKPYPSSMSETSYLTRYLDNVIWTQTTTEDFNNGILDSTKVVDDGGGAVELQSGHADWCKPANYIVNQIPLPKLSNAVYAQEGHAWLGAGGSASEAQFINVAVDDSGASPSASVVGTFNGAETVNSIFSDGSYVYLATSATSNQIKILDISTTPYSLKGSIDLFNSNAGANGVYVVGNTLYATSGKNIYSYNITSKTNPTYISSTSLTAGIFDLFGRYGHNYFPDAVAKQIVVIGNKAYVGSGNTIFGLQVFNLSSSHTFLSIYAVSYFPYTQESQGLYVNNDATRAYLAFNDGGGGWSRGFYIVDLTSAHTFIPFLLPPIYDDVNGNGTGTGTMDPRGMTIVEDGKKAIVVGVGGDASFDQNKQYQVFNIEGAQEQNPSRCGALAVSGGVYGISSILNSDGNAFSYITTGDTDKPFKIIEGGDGAAGPGSGTFTSSPLSVSYPTSVNYFSADVDQPTNTTIQMQVAGADLGSDGTCATASYTFVGPDGLPSSYFTDSDGKISGSVPFGSHSTNYINPARCFKYKTYFSTGDSGKTPVLKQTDFNHSP
jgi:type II secretory pathway pseudopilin PulG